VHSALTSITWMLVTVHAKMISRLMSALRMSTHFFHTSIISSSYSQFLSTLFKSVAGMVSLPLELLQQILTHVPQTSLSKCRLVSHDFSTVSFPLLFSHIPRWLDYTVSHQAIIALAHDAYNRPAVMWSPWASEPNDPVDDIWLGIVWRFLMKFDPPAGKGYSLTAANFAELSGRKEISEKRLRTSQNRFLLYQSVYGGEDGGRDLDGSLL